MIEEMAGYLVWSLFFLVIALLCNCWNQYWLMKKLPDDVEYEKHMVAAAKLMTVCSAASILVLILALVDVNNGDESAESLDPKVATL